MARSGAVIAVLALLATAAPPAVANPRWGDTTVADWVLEPVAAVALDRGRPRVVYVDAGEQGGVVTYAWCDDACQDPGSWARTAVTSGDVFYEVALAIDPWGRPHVAFLEQDTVSYATCRDGCGDSASWSIGWSDRVGWSRHNGASSLALDGWGRPRIAAATDAGDVVFASCDRGCGSASNWTSELLATSLRHVSDPSLVYTGVRPHLAVVRGTNGSDIRRVAYLTCERHCLSPESWDGTSVDVWDASGPTSLAVDGDVVRLTAVANRRNSPPHNEFWACTSGCTSGANWSRPRAFGAGPVDVDLRVSSGTPHVAYVAGDGRLVHSVCQERCECVGECEDGQDWEGETLVNDALGSIGLAVDGRQPVVAAVTGQDGSNDGLRMFRCTVCGEPGSYGAPPSGDPPPSTSTYRPESSTHGGSSPPSSPDDGGGSSSTSTAVDESDGGPTSWTLPGPDMQAPADPTVRERYRLEGPKPEIRPAEPGAGGSDSPTPGGDERAAGPSGRLIDRGATAVAFTLFLAFGGLALLVYLRLVRPLAQVRRR